MTEAMTVPLQETPEFRAAVAEAARAAAEEATHRILAEMRSVAPLDGGFAEKLAMAISQLTDQDIGRKRLPPEEMERRQKARKRMERLIQQAAEQGRAPRYALTGEVYLDERLIQPMYLDEYHKARQQEISWHDVPNEQMTPVNDVAREIHGAFMESIGGRTEEGVRSRDFGLTAKGLVVHDGGIQAKGRVTPDVLMGHAEPRMDLGMNEMANVGRYETVQVLGTGPAGRARKTV